MYRKQYSVKYRAAPYSARSASRPYAPQRASYTGLGAYRKRRYLAPRKRYVKRLGAYYIKGDVSGSAKIPGIGKVNASLAGGYADTVTGLGAYNISNIRHNALIKPDIPEVRNAIYAEGGTIIRHREYLGAITTAATAGHFKIQTFPLNPAQQLTFPWLSTIAQNYEEYKPHGLMFEFRSTASDAIASSTNLALGQIMMCTQYDPTDPVFLSDSELLNYTWAQSGKVSDNIQHFVECDPNQSPLSHLYTRAGGAESSDSDLRFSDFGRFSIASSGLQGTSVQIGQLWVTYEFILYKPKVGSAGAESGGWFHAANNSGLNALTFPFGLLSGLTYDAENNLGIVVKDSPISADRGRIEFPTPLVPVTYMVVITVVGSADTANCGFFRPGGNSANVLFVDHIYNNSLKQLATPKVLMTTDRITYLTFVNIMPSDSITVSYIDVETEGIYPTNPAIDIFVTQLPYLSTDIYG